MKATHSKSDVRDFSIFRKIYKNYSKMNRYQEVIFSGYSTFSMTSSKHLSALEIDLTGSLHPVNHYEGHTRATSVSTLNKSRLIGAV